MRCFVLAFSVLAFSSTCVFSAPTETDDQSDAFSIKLASACLLRRDAAAAAAATRRS